MQYSGNLSKMRVELTDPVSYRLALGDHDIDLGTVLGKSLTITFEQQINCIHCGRTTRKSFAQGYCYPCFASLPECDSCIMSPEKCHYAAGTCRDPAWGDAHCMQPHIVYLSNTSHLKVGITRQQQVPVRWIDQGAIQALPLFRTRTRHVAGLLEDRLRCYVSDRTSWQKMLKGQTRPLDLPDARDELLAQADNLKFVDSGEYELLPDGEPTNISYPVTSYPEKVKSINLDKSTLVSGVLIGIHGQYLILDTGVLNVRKFGGYLVTVDIE